MLKAEQDNNLDWLDGYVDDLLDEEIDALWDAITDIDSAESFDPLLKFKIGNKGQQELLDTIHNITLILCGNRWGKTFAMCFFLVATALGRLVKSRHQPDPSRVLRVWFIAKTYKTINDEILKTILGFLKKGQYRLYKENNYVTKLEIYGPNGSVTEVLFKPANSTDPDTFESSSPHYILVDEGVSEDIFARCMIRLGGNRGQYVQCFTRLSYNFVSELAKGRGQFKQLYHKGHVKVIYGRSRDNKFLTDEEFELMEASTAGNDFMRRARLEGEVDKPEGMVFNFRESIFDEYSGREFKYNAFAFSEFRDIYTKHEGYWYLLHDYGYGVPSCWLLVWVDRTTGTTYFVEEIYEKGMSIEKSAKKVYDMLQRWGCYDTLRECIADVQIKSDTKKEHEADATANILGQYLSVQIEIAEGVFVSAFPPQIAWICKQKHKNRVEYGLQLVNSMVELENPLTPGLPFYRFSPKCEMACSEFRRLMFITRPDRSTSRNEITEGPDHAIDSVRYFTMYRVNHTIWENRGAQNDINELGYLIGYSMASYFNF
jgi:hypothetical protein